MQPPPCVIDIEASGFGRSSYPIEVGYVLPDGRARCMLVRPAEGWTHWDEAAAQVHGITREVLQSLGYAATEIDSLLRSGAVAAPAPAGEPANAAR